MGSVRPADVTDQAYVCLADGEADGDGCLATMWSVIRTGTTRSVRVLAGPLAVDSSEIAALRALGVRVDSYSGAPWDAVCALGAELERVILLAPSVVMLKNADALFRLTLDSTGFAAPRPFTRALLAADGTRALGENPQSELVLMHLALCVAPLAPTLLDDETPHASVARGLRSMADATGWTALPPTALVAASLLGLGSQADAQALVDGAHALVLDRQAFCSAGAQSAVRLFDALAGEATAVAAAGASVEAQVRVAALWSRLGEP